MAAIKLEASKFSYIFCSCELMTYMSSRDTRKLLAKILIIIICLDNFL